MQQKRFSLSTEHIRKHQSARHKADGIGKPDQYGPGNPQAQRPPSAGQVSLIKDNGQKAEEPVCDIRFKHVGILQQKGKGGRESHTGNRVLHLENLCENPKEQRQNPHIGRHGGNPQHKIRISQKQCENFYCIEPSHRCRLDQFQGLPGQISQIPLRK